MKKCSVYLPLLAMFLILCSMIQVKGERVYRKKANQENILDSRVVKLKGAHNFRDVGGFKNKDGKLVKTGLLFRSDDLTKLSDGDLVKLEMLGVNKILDLRSIHEINLTADRMPRGACFFHRQIGEDAVDPHAFTQKLLSGYWTGEEFHQFMIDGNRQMTVEGKSVFPMIIDDIISNKTGATVFHCAGGKDRTGLVAALILSILEVPRELIFQDYLYTNIQRKEQFVEKFAKLKKASHSPIKDDLLNAMKANRNYLQSAFNTIDNEYGGIEEYVKTYLGISEEKIQQLRAKMLK